MGNNQTEDHSLRIRGQEDCTARISFHDMANYLQNRGYRVIVSEWYPLRRYGTDGEWRRFAAYPCNLKNKNAWGNLLAAREESDFRAILDIFRHPRTRG